MTIHLSYLHILYIAYGLLVALNIAGLVVGVMRYCKNNVSIHAKLDAILQTLILQARAEEPRVQVEHADATKSWYRNDRREVQYVDDVPSGSYFEDREGTIYHLSSSGRVQVIKTSPDAESLSEGSFYPEGCNNWISARAPLTIVDKPEGD